MMPPEQSTNPTSEALAFVPEDTAPLLKELEKDFDRLKQQKARQTGGVEGTTLINLCMLHDEQYVAYKNKTLSLEPRDANKLNLVFNLIAPRFNKLIGRLSAFNAPFKARPNKKDPQALENAEVVDRMILALDEKLDEPSRMRERLYWMGVGGVCAEYIPWVPNATMESTPQFAGEEVLFKDKASGQTLPQSAVDQAVAAGTPPEQFEIYEEVTLTGEVGSEVIGPFNLFIDQGVRSVADLPPDAWVHVAKIRTTGWVEENFQQKVEPQTELSLVTSKIMPEGESSGGVFLKDLLPMVQGTASESDPPMVIVVESFQNISSKNPHGRYVCWIPNDRILHNDVNPYDEIPIVDIHWAPATTSFWSKAYITPLVAPQRFINKRMSQLGEQANAAVYAVKLLGNGIKAGDIPADFPGVVENGLNDQGVPMVQNAPPPEFPAWFLPSIELAVKMFNDAAGGMDLMEDNKFPGQLRGPMAVPMLQEILDTQWGPLFNHLGERLAKIKQMRLNRVKQFYPPVRTMHYTDRNQKDEVMEFHTEEILKTGTNYTVTVDRGSILPEFRALREARVSERLAGPLAVLYMDERTGRLDKSKIAADLQFGDVGREGRESTYRKLTLEIIKMMQDGKPVPPVQPFYDHVACMDELEAAMATTEHLKASPQIQMLFADRWQQHATFLQQEAMMQQQAMQGQMIHSAVAQATQQAAATAAADAVHEAMAQSHAQKQQPTEQYVSQAEQKTAGGPANRPQPTKRKMTIEESR